MKNTRLNKISMLFKQYQKKKINKDNLLTLIDETELAEQVYNSNAIENSTLTLPETEKILLQLEISRHVSLREVFEAKNLALVYGYIKKTAHEKPLSIDLILLLHKMLLTNINDDAAGRFRTGSEMVRVGSHIGVAPKFISEKINEIIIQFTSDVTTPYINKIARLHCQFENIHPFIDGNGRIGRVINNYLLNRFGFPPIIIRNKDKQIYYKALRTYDADFDERPMIKIFELAVLETLHKRLSYLNGLYILPLAKYAQSQFKSLANLINAARRQTIPAFREKGVWKIGVKK